jgi:hypothetical protein
MWVQYYDFENNGIVSSIPIFLCIMFLVGTISIMRVKVEKLIPTKLTIKYC